MRGNNEKIRNQITYEVRDHVRGYITKDLRDHYWYISGFKVTAHVQRQLRDQVWRQLRDPIERGLNET